MPNIVAARPVAGAPIETSWGGEVHDRVEAVQLIQAGRATVTFNGTGDSLATITFPIPFAAPPVVSVTFDQGSIFIGGCSAVTATGCNVTLRHYNNTNQSAGSTGIAEWIAVGTAVGG